MLKLLTIILLLTTMTIQANEDKADNGEKLHQQHCRQCHDDSIYTRNDSIIFSYQALVKRVRFCESMANASLTDNQITQVVEYLNKQYYNFKKP